MKTGIQFISIVFSLVMLYITYLHYKKKSLTLVETSLFSAIWIGSVILTIIPQSANFILETFKVNRLLDLATIVGFMILVGLSFRNYLDLKEAKRKIEKITQYLALHDVKKK